MAELSLYKLLMDKANKAGDTFTGQITTTVSDKAPFVLDTNAANYIVTNLNADKLDGYDASAFLKLAGGTMTGDITFTPTISSASKGIVWSGLTDTHSIFVEEYGGSESTRLVIQNKDNGDADYTVFRNFNSTTSVDALEIRNTYITTPVQIKSTVVGTTTTGSSPFVVASSKKVTNLNSDLVDDMDTATAGTASTIAARDTSGNLTANVLISTTTANNTAPLNVASSVMVANLNANKVGGYDASYLKFKKGAAITDFNLAPALTDGEYEVNSGASITNAPFTGAIYGKLRVYVSDGSTHDNLNNWIWQYFDDSTGNTYTRYKAKNGVWGDWGRILTTSKSGAGVDADTLDGIDSTGFATKVHNLVDTTNHTVSGLTTNHVLTALTGTTYGFSAASTHGNHVPAVQTADNAKFLRNDNSWATVTPANIGAAGVSHGNHVPTTQTADNTTFLRNDNTWYKLTLTDIGAAPTSHGNHVPTVQTADNKVFLRNDNTWQTVTPANIGAAPSGYGLGTVANRLTAGTDLNTVVTNGWYDVNGPVNGVPLATSITATAMTWHSVFVNATADANYVTQLAFAMTDGVQNSVFMRQKKTGTWGSWIPLATVLGTSTAGYFDNTTTAPSSTTSRLNYNGNFYATKVYNAVFNDYAEYFLKDDKELEPGDVVIKNKEGKGYIKSRYAYDKLVVGVYSDDYAQCIGGKGDGTDEENFASVGMAGRVRVKVTGLVEEGDLLVASDIPGIAMVCKDYKPGTVIGKALESYNEEGIARIQMLIVNM